MKRIYIDAPFATGQRCPLPAEAFHYVVRVLRCRDRESLSVFNGDGFDYAATLQMNGKKSAEVMIENSVENYSESPLHTTLIQGLSKGERMDIVMQKAVELGVNCIIPVRSEFCAVKLDGARLQKKMQHWQSVMISACEQSGRAVLPRLQPVQTLDEALASVDAEARLLLHPYEAKSAHSLSVQMPSSAAVLIGPEGGFSDAEVERAIAHQFTPIILGKRILRTETAAIAALSLCQQLWGDWHVD